MIAFTEHLSQANVDRLVEAWNQSGLDYLDVRPAVLPANQSFRNTLLRNQIPSVQLVLDLNKLNTTERLVTGEVPLQTWLAGALRFMKSLPQGAVLEEALDDVAHRASGAPRLDVTALPETKEVFVHEDDMVPPSFMLRGIEAARAVAKLLVPRHEQGVPVLKSQEPVFFFGTGWLITPDLLVTNHHVVNARREGEPAAAGPDLSLQAAGTVARFDFDSAQSAGDVVKALSLEACDASLDYAVLRLAATNRRGLALSKVRLEKSPFVGVAVNIVQHPDGNAKRFAIRNNLVSASDAIDLRYFTDTSGGSSGSPVFDDEWRVRALHRGATRCTGVQFNGRSVAWVNVGTHLPAILADLANRHPALAAEIAAADV